MRKNVTKVMEAFDNRQPAAAATVHTDGTTVWSYDMPILQRCADGRIEALPVRCGPTMTTKMHMSSALAWLAFQCQPYTTVQVLSGRAPHVLRKRVGSR